jgi:SAM-dependent methyltransferase
MVNFYDKVAKKFGGYGYSNSDPEYRSDFQDENPEEVFRQKVEYYSGNDLVALDVGCGDGIFAFKLASMFKKIVGLDSSKGLLEIADLKRTELNINNVEFVYGDASEAPFNSGSFDLIFNRRGPSFYNEYSRLLKPGGYYIEIGIGEQDTVPLKKIFGRGQDYGKWNKSRLKTDQEEMATAGLNLIFGKDYLYDEYYKNTNDFELFLQGVPIFEDFDVAKDNEYLKSYYKTHSGKNSEIKLERHRIVLVAQK